MQHQVKSKTSTNKMFCISLQNWSHIFHSVLSCCWTLHQNKLHFFFQPVLRFTFLLHNVLSGYSFNSSKVYKITVFWGDHLNIWSGPLCRKNNMKSTEISNRYHVSLHRSDLDANKNKYFLFEQWMILNLDLGFGCKGQNWISGQIIQNCQIILLNSVKQSICIYFIYLTYLFI